MSIDILGFFMDVLNKYGVNSVMFCVICFLLWRLGSNHLRHIAVDVKTCVTKIDTLSTEVKESQKETNKKIDAVKDKVELLESKTAKIEGKIGI